MKAILCGSLLVFAPALSLPLGAAPIDPAAKTLGVVDEDTNKLYKVVADSQWNYVWRHTTVEIDFGGDGDITKSPWGKASWRITGPRTITISVEHQLGNATSKQMVLHFVNMQKFDCKDWNGSASYGALISTKQPAGH